MSEVADRLAADLDVRHHGDLGVGILDFGRGVDRGLVELAEATGKSEQRRVVQVLAAETQHEVLVPSRLDRLEGAIVQRTRQIDAEDIGSERGARGHHRDTSGGRGVHDFLRCRPARGMLMHGAPRRQAACARALSGA
jgi:hypothetical protein